MELLINKNATRSGKIYDNNNLRDVTRSGKIYDKNNLRDVTSSVEGASYPITPPLIADSLLVGTAGEADKMLNSAHGTKGVPYETPIGGIASLNAPLGTLGKTAPPIGAPMVVSSLGETASTIGAPMVVNGSNRVPSPMIADSLVSPAGEAVPHESSLGKTVPSIGAPMVVNEYIVSKGEYEYYIRHGINLELIKQGWLYVHDARSAYYIRDGIKLDLIKECGL